MRFKEPYKYTTFEKAKLEGTTNYTETYTKPVKDTKGANAYLENLNTINKAFASHNLILRSVITSDIPFMAETSYNRSHKRFKIAPKKAGKARAAKSAKPQRPQSAWSCYKSNYSRSHHTNQKLTF